MYGLPPLFRPGGGGREAAQPPQQQQIPLNTNIFSNPAFFIPQQNPTFLPHLNPYLQNPTGFPQMQQQFPNSNIPFQMIPDNNYFQALPTNGGNNGKFPQQHVMMRNEMVEKVDNAAMRARSELLELNENVSTWKVSQAALLKVKAESWESLGFQMQQVPSLNRLLVIEGKINAFIHCFVVVRRITSLYDLEVAICESEGVERFEELELGPLLRHPLVVYYFSVSSDLTEVYKIKTEEIISCLCEFIDSHKRKQIKVDTFLDFISMKQSVTGREKLCVHIQDFGAYISHIKQARQSEDRVLEKCYEKMRLKSVKGTRKRPLFSAQKKELDDHFTAISQRIESFSSADTQFCGKHIRFSPSSSDDDDDSDANEYEDNQDEKKTESNCSLSQLEVRSDRVSSCPYPSEIEEMTRLGLKTELESASCTPSGGIRSNADNGFSRRKRRNENMSSSTSLPRKFLKRDKFDEDFRNKGSGNQGSGRHSLSTESLKMFFTTWKEVCQVSNVDEVLERMLQFYNTREKRKVKELFTSYPFVGLLCAAVTCIKFGMWDNMYNTFQTLSQQAINDKPFESSADYISIDVEPAKKDVAVSAQKFLTHKHDVRAENVAKKISEYLEDGVLSDKNPSRENKLHFLRALCKCENWLIEQYCIDKFESLGYGEYLMFLEKYMHLLPQALQKCIVGDMSENVCLEAHLKPIQLEVLQSQALNSLRENEQRNMWNVSELLAKQFPLVCFKLVNGDLPENCPDILREKSCSLSSNSVLFSIPLSRLNHVCDSAAQIEKKVEETSGLANNTAINNGMVAVVTTKDAIDAILKAPMMTDLNMWLHWDILFAPLLGSIVEWLLKEVNTKELLCLITKDGKVIRIDHSATVDSFLKVFLRGSSFETAVQLLSLIALYGGEQNVPLSLLKCHARQAFEVIINNYLQMGLHNDKNPLIHRNPLSDPHIVGKSTSSDLVGKLPNSRSILNKAAPVMARFILDCLSYLPIEFCSFAADLLIAGLQSFVSNVPAAILAECKHINLRLMLHEVGISLGLMEWVHDYQSFCSSATTGFPPELSCSDLVNSDLNRRSVVGRGELDKCISSGEMLVCCDIDRNGLSDEGVVVRDGSAKVSGECQDANSVRLSTLDNHIGNDPTRVIESIRREEFGLDQSLSATESNMLEKQHARLGRSLHCLSQELYSQDSHFLLELVQNADDNVYPENVEPTLTFILQEEGIVVLNNEEGFSANNIRALCDVGNSTKKGHNAGFIGKKGIGFKSVFRVTSEKLLADIGLKTQVALNDALSVLRFWRKSESPFKASLSQMSSFYSFLWKGMALSKKEILEELHSGPFIFVPNTSSYSEEVAVPGALLSPQEVYWHDTIGIVDQTKSVHPDCIPSIVSTQSTMLHYFYPDLHDFFVNECGVDESPSLRSYLQILLQLSTTTLPHVTAKRVCEVFLMWDDALKSGSLSFEDVKYLKESLREKEYTVLPTIQDKWVSLHPSFGLMCWCDDDDLRKEFRHLYGIDFLHFGESTDERNRMLGVKGSAIFEKLGIPTLSEIVTRESICYGPADCSFIFSLVNWVLPYAQRFIYNAYPDKYFQLKQSGFENLKRLKIVVVEKLFYRNVIKKCDIKSKKRHLCNCLLQDNILYCSRESDPHLIFLELSRLLFNRTPDLHFANFLHMITTMAESRATEEQTEFFILNSQKVPKLPIGESSWFLSSTENNNSTLLENCLPLKIEEQSFSNSKRRPGISSNWPPVDWKNAPGFNSYSVSCASGLKKIKDEIPVEKNIDHSDTSPPAEISDDTNIEVDLTVTAQGTVSLEGEIAESYQSSVLSLNPVLDSADLILPDSKIYIPSNNGEGGGQVSAAHQQAKLTGRLGELVAFKYFAGKVGEVFVKWVNETNESGLPYDIVLGGDDENSREYIEVKATKSGRKNWFLISMREWQFAIEKGESFSIVHVVLADDDMAKVTVYKNLARLCQLGNLRLAVVVPKE